jgi:hypothetical protein
MAPRELTVLAHEALSPAEQSFALTLQGLLNRKEPTLLLRTGKGTFGRIFEERMRKEGFRLIEVQTVWELLARYRSRVCGGIVFRLNTPSLSVATSLAGILDSVAIDESLLDRANKEGLKVLKDVREWDERRLLAEYGDRFTRGILVEQGLDKPGHLRDIAVSRKAFTFWADKDSAFRQAVVKRFGPEALVYGWGPDEFEWVRDLSMGNATGIPADWALNLSLYEKLPVKKLRRPRRPTLQVAEGTHYIAFVLSDGDNIQWLTGGFVNDAKFWGSPLRGAFPMTWEIAPVLARDAPHVLDHLYNAATPNDGFVTGAGLLGYTYAHFQPNPESLARQTEPYLKAADLPVISLLNANEGNLRDAIPLLRLKSVSGAIYKDYAPYHRSKGQILWHEGKPVVSYRCLLWEGLMSPEQVAATVALLPRSPQHDPQSFTLVNVHAWSYGNSGGPLTAVQKAISLLPPHVKVVTADQIIAAMRKIGP